MQENKKIDGIKVELLNLAQTEIFGKLLALFALPGDIICLDGDLGAGKTTLTQSVAKGLDVPESSYVASPSFAILHEHEGRIPLYHMDFYRLGDPLEIEEQGFAEYFYKTGLCVIEWAVVGEGIIPEPRLSIHMDFDHAGKHRVEISGSMRHPDFPTLFIKNLQEQGLLER